MTAVAKQEHIIPTQVISVAGYSLSLMLIVFAAALYMGWLPANSGQTDLAEQKPAVPVVKSPETPPKTKVAEPARPSEEQDAAPEAAPSPPQQDTVATEEPSPPAEAPAPSEDDPAEPKPVESAQNESAEGTTSQPALPEDETALLDRQDAEKLPEDEAAEPDADVAKAPDEAETPRSSDTLTAQDLKPESETQGEAPQPIEDGAAKTAETEAEAEETAEAPGPAPAPEPGEQAKAAPGEPKVRIIIPPETGKPADQAPSVVIRIPKDPTGELKVLPRPKAVPDEKPKAVEQSPTVVVRIPQSEEQPREQPLRPVVPRAKPAQSTGGTAKAVDLPRIDPPEPSAKPASPAKPVIATSEADAEDPMPRPLPKPRRLTRVPDHTAAIAPQDEVRKKARRTPQAEDNTERPRLRTKRPGKTAKPRSKQRRTRLVRTRIHRPPVNDREIRQNVSFDQDTYCLAIAIYYEAGRKNLRDQVAVSREILHRVESFNFPNTVCEVVYQYAHRRGECRYAFTCDGLPDRPKNKAVWNRAKMLAKAQINCGPRCGCYLQKPTLVSNSKGRSRRVIRCRAGIQTPAPRKLADTGEGLKLEIRPVASPTLNGGISSLGRVDR